MTTHTETGSIRVESVPTCHLCEENGNLLYSDLPDRLYGVPGKWNLFQCPKCNLIWCTPRATPEDLMKIYENYLTHNSGGDEKARQTIIQEFVASYVLRAKGYDSLDTSLTKRLLGTVLGRIPMFRDLGESQVMFLEGHRKGLLLDVGCGNGAYLARMRDLGWQVMGVEPDPKAAAVAQTSFDFPVIQGTIEEACLESDSVDAITMGHVIEHVHDPSSVLQECYRVLKPGGKLILLTPNANSLGYKIFKWAWRELDVPRHLYLFEKNTLCPLLERNNIQIDVCRTNSRYALPMWGVSRVIRRDGKWSGGRIAHWQLLEGAIFWIVEEALRILWGNAGEELLVIGSKPR